MATATALVTTTGASFSGVAITLSGNADVLVFAGFGDFYAPAGWGVRLTKGGNNYDFTLAVSDSGSGRGVAIYYYTGAAALGAGAATISRISSVNGCGGTLYELAGVIAQAPEVTASFDSGGSATSSSQAVTTLTNGAHVIASCVQDSANTNGCAGVLDSYVAGTHEYPGAAGEGAADAAGEYTATFNLSAANSLRGMAVAAWAADGTVVPTDVGITFSGLQAGSEVRLYERAHPQEWTIDLTGATPALCDGRVLHYEVQGASAVTVHEVWIDLDDGSDTPYGATAWAGETVYAAEDYVTNGGRLYVCTTGGTSAASGGPTGTGTGIEDGTCEWDYVTDYAWCDIATGNTAVQIAAAIEAVIDDDSDVTSSVSDEVISVANNRDGGPLAIPTATFPASVTVVQEGCDANGTTAIDYVEDSSGDWVADVTVASPREVTVVIMHTDYKFVRFAQLVGREDQSIPAGALQTEDRVYANPS